MTLPDPLTRLDGTRVATPKDWPERRAEILELFRTNVYGRAPIGRPDDLAFDTAVTSSPTSPTAAHRRIALSCRGRVIVNLSLFIPAEATHPIPCFVLIDNRGREHTDAQEADSEFWPVERLLARGYAAASFHTGNVAPDEPGRFSDGVHGLFDPAGSRAADAWGAIGAWAWGASRVLDYLQTDQAVDASRVAVVGHSRGGKAALWAGAQDERFALTVSNESGCTGAALSRGKRGETIKDINRSFPHWFCDNYKRFNDREDELPVDQHLLLSLIAPRLLYIASAGADEWADPAAEFAAAVAASPVYRYLGRDGLEQTHWPPPQMPLHAGHIGHHIRPGGHDLRTYDWECFLDFADRHLSVASP